MGLKRAVCIKDREGGAEREREREALEVQDGKMILYTWRLVSVG